MARPDASSRLAVPAPAEVLSLSDARAVVVPTDRPDLLGYTPPDTPTFPDVPADYWSYKFVEYLAAEEIVLGYPDGSYRPEEVVTRDQMAVYVAKAFKLLD